MALLKLFFVTDIHGSTACFHKFINAALRKDGPNLLILGGDISGKFVVPEIEEAHGRSRLALPSGDLVLEENERAIAAERLADSGCYIYRCDETEYKKYRYDAERRKLVAEQLQLTRLQEWLTFADDRLAGTSTKVLVNCGNDDDFFLDTLIKQHPSVIFPEGQIVQVDEHLSVASVGYSTPTPWHCPRELPEEQLKRRIADLMSMVPNPSRCIFNFHCPPKDTSLDLAPRLDSQFRPVMGMSGIEMIHVGSSAVMEAIKEFQPPLSLHGHIHEQHRIERIGITQCVNPGSSYWTGSVQGVLATFRDGELIAVQLTKEIFSSQAVDAQKNLVRSLSKVFGGLAHLFTGNLDAQATASSDPQVSNFELARKLDQLQRQVGQLNGKDLHSEKPGDPKRTNIYS